MSRSAQPAFAALRHAGFRMYFLGNATAMLADNCEHVITYWAMFQKFNSAALAGFAVVSHWLPYLAFSGIVGALADRFDPRRMIQLGMLMFMGVSLAWGVLLATDSLHVWQAMLLLTLHGVAGVLWTPPAQLLIHDIVGPEELPSAVRLGATSRYLGTLLGPAVGSGLMLLASPAHGLFYNALIYLPMLLWLQRAPCRPRLHPAGESAARAPVRGLEDVRATLRALAQHPVLLSTTLFAGCTSMLIGQAYQPQMPGFALDLGHGDPGTAYSALLAADAAGALVGAVVLESRGLLRPGLRSALVLGMLWCVALGGFALTRHYPLALLLLFAAGFLELSWSAMAQALVQLNAPEVLRGHVIGVYAMCSLGLRLFSGLTVGVLGGLIGIHAALATSAAVLCAAIAAIMWAGTPAHRGVAA
ncbi:MAG: MFS transporter [Gammaproteobacteria bacterium]|nr:MFS transporter [Gammaproteobacteria bacterium]